MWMELANGRYASVFMPSIENNTTEIFHIFAELTLVLLKILYLFEVR